MAATGQDRSRRSGRPPPDDGWKAVPRTMVRAMRSLVASTWAPWALLAVSLILHVVVTLLGSDAFNMVDLKVYYDGAGHLFDGTLYDFFSEPLHLPFTYPTFSALIFTPMVWIPWTVLRVLWQAASFGAIGLMAYSTLKLLGRAGPGAPHPVRHLRGIVVTVIALGLWLEPVRTTFNYGQINLFLAALLLTGAAAAGPPAVPGDPMIDPKTTRRGDFWGGLSVGLAAGVKLTPALSGLYYLLQRRWWAVFWSVATFVATVAVGWIAAPSETVRFFTSLMFDPARTGPIWSAINQSLRGALSRVQGQDRVGVWLVCAALAFVLGLWCAWRSLRAGDRTAAFLAVQITALLISPISWSHHWVWVLPLLLWCLFGPRQRSAAARWLAIAWTVATCSYVVSILIAQQYEDQPASRPLWQSALGVVYPLLGLVTLAVLARLAGRPVTDGPVPIGRGQRAVDPGRG
ncbi:glycosyltransferase 87 family protein [Nakamurella flava]|nr:glycosyltransferase 87 family protein [Nakamurella flava]